MALRLIFMGTPDFSVGTLQALAGAGHEIVAVYSQPPRPAGRRGLELTKSPVHQAAEALGVEVRTPKSLKGEDEQAAFAALEADAAIVVAYGLLLPKPILEGTRLGCFNGHASLLPRWRGAAPIQRAIMAGDTETGMMVMKMDEGLDTGPVAMTSRVAITPDMTGGELHDVLKETGASLMVEAMDALEKGALTLTPQPEEGATYAKKILKDETRVDWNSPARAVHDHIRGLSPFPGAWCEMTLGSKPERVKLLRAERADGKGAPGEVLDDALTIACGDGAVQLTEVQRAGGKPMRAVDFLRGAKLGKGTVLP
ncbi:methionyl-tRNA formyltransferase [Nitratireductor sp. L1-7-SE]|uniref:Methionyl-tRNA formyltransferase n=1 Tax=Nitratireductor rhodophyticola TaxID=2854036 RepID=A0ABS7R785_9HYPH|nr:methionyl-tRNA formyltransferase [Nitratireductor rhodophyticola]MBY8916798.1 methionyl-tRNA formyltransferase [Nitratireductor rhodophyticola]MBY8920773.1 methionyl-tRNA formyltransferase [Nitratireductor rhodophyticola]